jgi:hydrogenase-1 operon protein HyaF
MAKLESIAVSVEHATGNLLPILHEVRHALQRLQETGEPTVIDLMAIPMAPGEEGQLEDVLGSGEIKAQLDCLGPSEIFETGIAGVWLIAHYNADHERVGRFLEITRLPAILESQEADMWRGLTELIRRIGSLEAGEAPNHSANPVQMGDRSNTTRTVE